VTFFALPDSILLNETCKKPGLAVSCKFSVTLPGTVPYPLPAGTVEEDVPFPKVGYLIPPQGIKIDGKFPWPLRKVKVLKQIRPIAPRKKSQWILVPKHRVLDKTFSLKIGFCNTYLHIFAVKCVFVLREFIEAL